MVGQIPYGKVVTYGQIATLAGYPGRARQVGYALAGMPEELDLPWHRVINAQGRISPRVRTRFHELQHVLLENEGIVFEGVWIDLERYGWKPAEEGAGA
jgi:methylated-DNA-protein-cysteine methyltransferase-like protein